MKATIEKLPTGRLKIVIATNTASKPITFETTPAQLADWTRLIQLGAQSETFKFSIEL